MSRALAAALAALALAALAGCGVKEESTGPPSPRSVDLVLDFFPNADHVGIYAALANGDFRRAGLDVRPRAPSDPAAPLKLLAAGRADLAISYEPEVLLAREQGLDVVSVGAIVQRPLTSIIALPGSKVRGAADLKGKRVGTAGIPYQAAYLKTILDRASVNPASVREVNVGFNLVPALLSKRVDATLGGFWNYEGIQLKERRKRPLVIPVDRAGVPPYDELVVVARGGDLHGDGATRVRSFLRALSLGYRSVRRDPVAGVRALVRANPDLDRRLQLASVRATLPAFFPGGGRPFGFQDLRQWSVYGAWMLRNQLLRRPPAISRAVTNDLLPGEGL
jgi:putative hydroxymethylpyrimidine transport system substrate-binding protein